MDASAERWADGPTLLGSIWRYRWLVAGVTVALGFVSYLVAAQQDEVYLASAELYLTDPGSSDVFGQAGGTNLERYVPQQTERITSTPVLTAAAEELGDGATPATIRDAVEVTGNAEIGTLTIAARSGDPDRAAEVANIVTLAYEESVRAAQLERADRAASELEIAEEDIQQQIEQLTAAATGNVGTAAIDGQLNVLAQRLVEIDTVTQQFRVDARLFGSGVEFVEAAERPGAPIEPTPRRTAAAAAVLGAMLASAGSYWLAGRGRRVAGRDDAAELLGVPLLGVLPTYAVANEGSLRERAELDPRTAEAYRFVYSSLRRVLGELSASSVLITSASPGTGKTETALQLAITANERGARVLLVDGDVRMRGLTTFLRGGRYLGLLDLAHQPSDTAAFELINFYPVSDEHDLAVLTAGIVHGDGPPQIQENWFGHHFPQLTTRFDLTLLDSPPLLAVADTATLAAYTDAVVLVIREGSSHDDLERVRQRMRFVGQRLVGYVYLTPTALDDAAFDYGLVRATPRTRGRPTAAVWEPNAPEAPATPRGRPLRAAPSAVQRVSRPDSDEPRAPAVGDGDDPRVERRS